MTTIRHGIHLSGVDSLFMKGIVIYESLTGNTAKAGFAIAEEMSKAGIQTTACSTKAVDLQALSDADIVVIGTWTDGLILLGQRPGGVGRLAQLPAIEGKKTAVFCTYAINAGKTLEKLSGVVARRGGEVIGGATIRRDRIKPSSVEFVDRLLGALEVA